MTDDLPDSTDRIDHELAAPTGPAVSDRYARLLLEDDSVIVYDRSCTDAWIQSDFAIPLPVDGASVSCGLSTPGSDLPDIRRD